jgi:hypothetical protein
MNLRRLENRVALMLIWGAVGTGGFGLGRWAGLW